MFIALSPHKLFHFNYKNVHENVLKPPLFSLSHNKLQIHKKKFLFNIKCPTVESVSLVS